MRQKVDRRRLDMRERVEENPKENAATGADFEERLERFAAEAAENRSNARELVASVFETIKFQSRRFAEFENPFDFRRAEVVERRFEEFRRERKRRLVDFFVERANDAAVGESVQRQTASVSGGETRIITFGNRIHCVGFLRKTRKTASVKGG
jgi:hypothetical protein